MKKIGVLALAITGSAMMATFVMQNNVFSFSHVAPDNNDVRQVQSGSGPTQLRLSSGQTRYVRNQTSTLRAWFTQSTGNQIIIQNGNFCRGHGGDYFQSGDEFSSLPAGRNITKYALSNTVAAYGKVYNQGDSRCNDPITLNLGRLTARENGYYYADLTVYHEPQGTSAFDGVMNYYFVTTNRGGGSYVGVRSDTSGSGMTMEQLNSRARNVRYEIPFGTDCKLTSNQSASLIFYDFDNGGSSGAQEGGKVRVQLYDETARVFVKLSNGNTIWTPSDIDNATQSINFTAVPGHKYKLVMDNVYYNNTVQYSLPYSQINYQPCQLKWNMTAETRVIGGSSPYSRTVTPGQTVEFTHYVGNRKPASVIDADWGPTFGFNWHIDRKWNNGNWSTGTGGLAGRYGSPLARNENVRIIDPSSSSRYTVPLNAQPGAEFCRRIAVSPYTNRTPFTREDAGRGEIGSNNKYYSNEACVTVAGVNTSYDLTPSVSVQGGKSVEPGGVVRDISGGVSNSGDRYGDDNTTSWFLGRVKYDPGETPPTIKGDNSSEPLDRLGPEKVEEQASGRGNFSNTRTGLGLGDYSTGDEDPLGTQYCWFMAVRPPSNTISQWRYSDLLCVVVGKKPKMQVTGGDVRVGGRIQTSLSSTPEGAIGSWGEYGVLSVGKNVRFASGAGLNTNAASMQQRPWSNLTFANDRLEVEGCSTTELGCFASNLSTQTNAIADYFERRASMTLSTNVTISDLNSGTYKYDRDNPLTINGGEITPDGRSVIIVATGKVTISGNITHGDSSQTSGSLPQVVVIADSIEIAEGVERVDAWLISKKWMNTCARNDISVSSQARDYADGVLTAAICGNKSTLNGVTSVGTDLYLYRTHGDGRSLEGGGRNDAQYAEVFNLRADAYIWAHRYSQESNSGVLQTVATRELPPRF